MRTNQLYSSRKEHSRKLLLIAFILGLMAISLVLEGCSAVVPQSSAAATAPAKSQLRPASQTVLPNATVGISYEDTLPGAGTSSRYVFTPRGEIPPGMLLNLQTGTISGVPTKAGTFTFSLDRSINQNGNPAVYVYTLTVKAATSTVPTLQVSPADTSVTAGGRVQFQASVKNTSNTAVVWSATAGSISASGLWTAPTASGLQSIRITATSVADSSVQSSAVATVTSPTPTLTITTQSLPSGTTATNYSAPLMASGGQAPYQWSIASGTLPAGINLDPGTGTLSGSASTAGTFSFAVQVADATSQTAQHNYSLLISNPGTNCGPPTYPCSRTDLQLAPLPSTLPNMGNLTGANTIITDPSFGNRIVRITDANTNPATNFQNRTFVTATSGSADENLWNIDSTLFLVQDTGARAYPFTFNPSTLQASRMYVSSLPATNGLTLAESGMWSRVSPNILFVASGTAISKYDFTDRTNAPSPELVYDFASSPNCLPAGFTKTWQSRGGVSGDDTVMAMGYSNKGGQGTGVYAVVYKVGSGCTVLNTQTGQVSGDWGAQGTISLPDRWTIHNVKLSKDGNWLVVARQGCISSSCLAQPYFWQIGTTKVVSCGEGGHCSGHWTEGYSHWVNNNGTPLGNQEIRQFAVPASATSLTFSFPSGLTGNLDQHQSWNNVDAADSVPFASTTWSPTTPFPAAWYNEIIAVAADGSGTTWRFAHSFITTQSQNFSTQYGIGSVSQDGRFFIFSSDWMGSLGSEQGARTCTVGTNCRGDVFVVEMR